MNANIRPFLQDDLESVVSLSILAWTPVFDSFRQVLGAEIYSRLYPDWKRQQREAVIQYCQGEKTEAWIAELDDLVVGFIVYEVNEKDLIGEVCMLAVLPEYQNRGIGTALNDFALRKLKAAGMRLAVVGTGGDAGHAPARRSYEKSGYTALPQVQYYKALLRGPNKAVKRTGTIAKPLHG